MYKLEDRILFDAAAVADVADAQQEADAQAEAAAQAAEAEEAAAQEAAESTDGGDFDSTEADDPGSLEAVLAAVEAGNLGSDGQRVDVLLVSNSLENVEDIINATSSDTIVVRYDARTTSAADLLQQISDALDGNLADSIGFATESGENAEVQLFADTDTSLDTVNDSTHQDFFSGLNILLDDGAQVNLFASNLASTAEGTALVDAIGDSIGHDVAASSDETGAESAGGDWNLEYSTSGIEVDVAETYLDENLIDNFDSLLEDHASHEIAFINSSLADADEILDDLGDNVEVVFLTSGQDGLDFITDYLNEHSDVKYDAVHILSHGNEGYFVLNGEVIDLDYVNENAADFVQWRNALSDDADIMIYGCNLAGNQDGQSLVATISALTGADVAASLDSVGGDDWSLEYGVGDINYGALDIHALNYELANQLVTNNTDSDDGSLRWAIDKVRKNNEITFDNDYNINLTTGALEIEDAGLTISGGSNTINITSTGGTASDIFIINDGKGLTLSNINITANTGFTALTNNGTLAISDTVDITGNVFNAADKIFDVNGDLTISSGTLENSGTLTVNSGGSITFDGTGGLENNSTFTAVTGSTVTFDGTQTISGTGSTYSFADLSIDGGTLALDADISISGSLTNAGTFTAAENSLVNYNGTAAQTIAGLNYHDLEISGSGIKTAGGDIGVDGAFTISDTATFTDAANTFTYNGINQDITVTGAAYFNLAIEGIGIKTLATDLTVGNNLTIATESTLDTNADLYITNNLENNGTILVGETIDGGSQTGGIGTIIYDGATTQVITAGTYYNLGINNSGKTLEGDVTVTNDFLFGLDAGLLTIAANQTLSIDGDIAGSQEGQSYFNFSDSTTGLLNYEITGGTANSVIVGNGGEWSSLSLSSVATNVIGIHALNGVTPTPAAPLTSVDMTFAFRQDAVGQTFTVSVLNSSVKGANFDRATESLNLYNGATWTDLTTTTITATDTNPSSYYFSSGTAPVTPLVVTSDLDDGTVGTLRFAIDYANSHTGDDDITFAVGMANTTITLSAAYDSLNISDDGITITNTSGGTVTIDGTNAPSGIMNVDDNTSTDINVTITGLTFINGQGTLTSGGAIYNNEILTLNTVSISDSTALNGGAIYNDGDGNITLNNVTISDNAATENGGAIYSEGILTFSGTNAFTDNTAGDAGGAIYVDTTGSFAYSTHTGTSITGDNLVNEAIFGGGIYSAATNLTVDTFTISETNASDGSLHGLGGGIYAVGNLALDTVTIEDGGAQTHGGAIYFASSGATLTMTGTNTIGAEAEGGATQGIYFVGSGTLTMNSATMNWNGDNAFHSIMAAGDLTIGGTSGIFALSGGATSGIIGADNMIVNTAAFAANTGIDLELRGDLTINSVTSFDSNSDIIFIAGGGDTHAFNAATSGAVTTTDITIDLDQTVNLGAGNTLNIHGDLTNNGTFSAGSGSTVNFNHFPVGTAQTISGTGTASFVNLRVDNTDTLTLSSTSSVSVSGILTIATGSTLVDSGELTLGSGATWTNNGTFTASTGTVIYTDAPGTTVLDEMYYNLTLEGSASFAYAHTVTNLLTIGTGLTVNAAAAMAVPNITLGVSSTLNISESLAVSGTFTANTDSSVNYNKADVQTIAGLNYYNLTVSNDGVKTAGGDIGVAGAFTISDTATFTDAANTFTYNGLNQDITVTDATYFNLAIAGIGGTKTLSTDLTVANNVTVSSPSTLDANAALTITDGDLTGDGTVLVGTTLTTTNGTINSTGTVIYDGATTQAITAGTYYNLGINNSDKTLGGNITVDNHFVFGLNAGLLDIETNTMNITGDIVGSEEGQSYFLFSDDSAGLLNFTVSASATESIIVGAYDDQGTPEAQWSSLSFTDASGATNVIGLHAFYGVTADGQPGVNTAGANDVAMTFNINPTAAVTIDLLDSSAKGSSFNQFTEVLNVNTAGTWGVAPSPATANDPYYFNSSGAASDYLYVTSLADDGSIGTLRIALDYANAQAGLDTITFNSALFASGAATINLSSSFSHLEISDDVIIQGPGSVLLTINGEDTPSRILTIDNNDASSIYAEISGITFAHGHSTLLNGGAIYNNEFLELNDIVISSSTAISGGALYNDSNGYILMDRVAISDNAASVAGGGIYNNGGKIQAENLLVSGNTAISGAGIYNTGDIMLQNSTISANIANLTGGGIFTQGMIYGENLTIANNEASEGSALYIDGQGSDLTSNTFFNATIALNTTTDKDGSAVYRATPADDTIYLNSTLMAGNSDNEATPAYSNINNTSTNYTSSNGYYTGDAGTAGSTSSNGFFTTSSVYDNGGWVSTLALNTSNATVIASIMGQGSNDGPTIYDARGYMRNGVRDIGAYEANAYVAINVDRDIHYTSIQSAIDAANNGDNIELVGSRIIVDTEISISDGVILSGYGAGVTVLDADSTRIFLIDDGSDTNYIYVRIDGMSFTGGTGQSTTSTGLGGAIYTKENLLLKNVSMYDNSAATSGGAIYNNGAFVAIERSDIYSNTAPIGGAVYNLAGTININESTFQGNAATAGSGGSVYSDIGTSSANVTITSSTFNNNSASVNGGAIYAEGVIEFTNSVFAYNSAVDGGAIYLADSGNWKMTNITVAYNTSTSGTGHALKVEDGNLFMINILIANNIDGKNYDAGNNTLVSRYNYYIQANGATTDTTIFSSDLLLDYGGWTKTLAITSDFSDNNTGTNIGVPGYDQRGYLSNGSRDIGAYEYEGYIGKVSFPNNDPAATIWISSLDQIDDYPDNKEDSVVTLINSRILETDTSFDMWYNTGVSATPRAARNITIYGHAAGGTVISAGNAGRLFTLNGTTNGASSPAAIMGTFTIERLTLSDSFAANGPVVTGVDTANNVGAFVAKEVTFKDNIATGDGGALYVASWDKQISYTISNSTFTNNISAGDGGAIYAAKPISVSLSTIADNRSFGSGGAIHIADGGTVTLSESTVSFNYASDAGGGIYNAGTLNTGGGLNLLAKNVHGEIGGTLSGYDYYLSDGSLTAGTNNMIEYQNGIWVKDVTTNFYREFNDDGDRLNYVGAEQYMFATDKLADNGGWTHTLALSEFSAALDPESARSGIDQRGYEASNWRDIGAMELNGTYVTLSSTGLKYSSIEKALVSATSGDTITISAVRITEHDIQISQDLTVVSVTTDGTDLVRGTNAFIDAKNYGRIFFIGSPSSTVSMSNLYLYNGMSLIASTSGTQQVAGNGGAIYNAGTLSATHLSVIDSFAQGSGGAIYSSTALSLSTDDTRVKLIDVELSNNSAGLYGGAIYASGTISVSGAEISGETTPLAGKNMYNFWYNSAELGGAIYTSTASDAGDVPAFKGIYARGNSAFSDGGALYVDGGDGITIAQSYFLYNSSMSRGGAIYQSSSDLTIWDSTISSNFAFSDGGAVYFTGGYAASMTIYASSEGTAKYMDIMSNYSLSGDGGAIYMTSAVDLNIYSEILLYGPYFYNNTAIDGDGGAIHFTNSNDINIGRSDEIYNNVDFWSNDAYNSSDKGHGGAIYMSNSLDFNIYLNTSFRYNYAEVEGGAIYILNSRNISMTENITVANNTVTDSHGGGIYLEDVQDITFNYLELGDNEAYSATSNGGGIYIQNSGDVSLTDVDAYDNQTGLNGGALYITDDSASALTIKSSGFDRNLSSQLGSGRGGAVYVATDATDVLLENVTFARNSDTAFYLAGSTSITMKYATFAYNDGTDISGIYIGSGNLAMTNSIIYETTDAPIDGTFTVTTSSHNVFYRSDEFTNSATGLYGTPVTSITAYNEGGGVGGSATVLDANGNIVGATGVTDTFISNNLYLSTEMFYHANYLTRALALESRDSIAFHYAVVGTDTRAGASDSSVNYDQRGNLRSGVEVVNTDGTITYVYYKHDGTDWQKIVVAEDGSFTSTEYTDPVYTSIGAFEPNFYITTTSSEDNSTNPDFVIHSVASVWHDFDVALTDSATSGITLRESIYWIDSYKLGSTANTSVDFSEDGSRYVKFTDNMINTGNTTITLDSSAEYISIRSDVIVGMVDDYNDGTNIYSFFEADNTFTDQTDGNSRRITVSGGGHSRAFALFSQTDLSGEANWWAYSAKVGLNNITVQDGLEDGSGQRTGDGDGLGGGIYNEGTLTLHNTLVKDSEASNVNISELVDKNRSNAGHGGGIYTIDQNQSYDSRGGYLYLYDSTIDNNVATGTAKNTSTINVAYGGGLYVRNGVVNVTRSTISSNETHGFSWDVTGPTQTNTQGGGLYEYSGSVTISASTITDNASQTTSGSGVSSAYGDAIYGRSGTLTMNSNTVAYNRVHRFTNGEGLAVYLSSSISSSLTNNIFANNYVTGLTENIGRDIVAYNVVTDTNNIVGHFNIAGHNFTTGTGNITGDNADGHVDQLYLSDELKYNGGMTQNYRLGANSVAIDAGGTGAGTTAVSTYDQRNLDRATTGNGRHSIGSYELLQTITAYTNVADEALTDGDIGYDYSYSSGTEHGRSGWDTNLRNALYLADQGATATINVADSITQIDLAENAGALLIFNDMTVVSSGGQITIDASNGGGDDVKSRAFIIDGSNFEVPSSTSTDVTITGFNIQNTNAVASINNGNGGAIYSRGHLTLNTVNITDFSAAGDGGALYLSGGNLTLSTVAISSTSGTATADGHGGGIYIDSGSIISSSNLTLSGTRANGHGGGIYVNNAIQTFNLSDSSITDAHALAGSGGAIYYTGQSMILDNVTMQSNSAYSTASGGSGGGLYAEISGTATITDSSIGGATASLGNTASNLGGGIYLSSGSLVMTGSTGEISLVQNNTATSHGGGIYLINAGMILTNSSVLDNTSGINGGGIYVASSSTVTVNSSAIGRNTAANYGGGLFINTPGFTSLNSTYSENTAGAYGGGMYFSNPGSMTLTYVTVANNISGVTSTTETDGGGIYINRGTLNMENSIVAQNYTGSIDPANHNDLYFGGMGTVGSITYSLIGDTNESAAIIAQTGNIVYGTNYTDWSELGIDTIMYNNGGDTMTVYVYTGSLAIGNGLSITATTTVDQRGTTRSTGTKPSGPTIGAYEKVDPTTYYFNTGDVNVETNWYTGIGGTGDQLATGQFELNDNNLYVFANTYDGTLTGTQEWTINDRSFVTVASGALFTIGGTATIKAISHKTGTDANMSLSVESTAGLTFANGQTQLVSLTSLGTTSDVNYTFAGNQTVYTATYGDLTISGSGIKTATTAITVSGTGTGLSVSNSTFIIGGALSSTDITLSSGIISTGTYDISISGDLSGAGTNSISGADISLTTVTNYAGDITGTGTVTASGNVDTDSGTISGSTVTLSGTGNTVDGDITSTGDVTFDGGTSTGTITGVTVNAEGTVANVNATTLASTSLEVTGTVATTNLNVTTLALSSDAHVESVNATITTINNASGINTLKTTADATTVNYSSWNINVSGGSLSIDRGSNDVYINQDAGFHTFFDIDNNITVTNDSTLKFITLGDAFLTNLDTTINPLLSSYVGTLYIGSDEVTLQGCDFSGPNMILILENTGYFNIATSNISTKFGNDFGVNDVRITAGTGLVATIESTTGSVTVRNVISDSPAYSLVLDAATSASIGSVTGMTNITLDATTTATTTGDINISGNFTTLNATTTNIGANLTTGVNVAINNDLDLSGNIAATGSVTIVGATTINGTGDTSITGSTLSLGGAITGTGTGTLTLESTATTTLNRVDILGGLTLSSGDFDSATPGATIDAGNINISSPATTLTMGANALTASGNLTNAGTLSSTGTVTATNGYISNTGAFTATTATANTNIINNSGADTFAVTTATATNGSITNTSGTFTATTATAGTSLTNNGTLTVATANVGTDLTNTGNLTISTALNLTGSSASVLNFGGNFSTNLLTVGINKQVNLTNGNVTVNTLTFNAAGNSKFNLNSQILEVTNTLTYNVSASGSNENYFITSGGGKLVQAMLSGSSVAYRVGNSSYCNEITLQTTAAGEKIAVGVIDSVKIDNTVVTGIQETDGFTISIDRNYGGGSATDAISVGMNWDSNWAGSQFINNSTVARFELIGNVWVSQEIISVSTTGGRTTTSYTQPHNGIYAIANIGANLTIPFTGPGFNGNIAFWEMSNPNYSSILGDVDNLSNFPIGQYPYFSTRGIFGDPASVGRSVYRHMEYRMAMNPLSNPLTGQVPAPGTLLGQAITEGADLNLTSDASVYLEVNGEYSIGRGWLPVGEPVSAANVEQYQAPITEGQLDEFYLEFGGRENIFDKPTSFRSDLDEILDDLLAG